METTPSTTALIDGRGEQYGAAHLTTSRIVQLLYSMHLHTNIIKSDVFFCWLMILNKLVRALADPSYKDNWADIAGYAELALRELEAHHDRPMHRQPEQCS